MPQRTPVDAALVLSVYGETGSGRETARRLNIHYGTVNAVIRRTRGKCLDCRNDPVPGGVRCSDCRRRLAERSKAKRADRVRQGICTLCDEQRTPLSRIYCAKHRLAHLEAAERNVAKSRKARGGVPDRRQKTEALRQFYGDAGVRAWERDKGRCVICRRGHDEIAVHVHHIDQNRKHNVLSNLVCLCFDCHRGTHALLRSPNLKRLLRFARKTYPASFS